VKNKADVGLLVRWYVREPATHPPPPKENENLTLNRLHYVGTATRGDSSREHPMLPVAAQISHAAGGTLYKRAGALSYPHPTPQQGTHWGPSPYVYGLRPWEG